MNIRATGMGMGMGLALSAILMLPTAALGQASGDVGTLTKEGASKVFPAKPLYSP